MASKRPPTPSPITLSKILLVEGQTPQHFFRAMARHLGIEDTIDLRDFGGVSELAVFLQVLARTTGFRQNARSVGIVRDAEADPVGARNSVKSAIDAAGFSSDVKVHTFILLDGKVPGNIETLCLRSVADSSINSCVNDFISCGAASAGVVWPDGYMRDKALVQIYAATLSPPQPYAGLASYGGAWPWSSPAFADVISFLQAI